MDTTLDTRGLLFEVTPGKCLGVSALQALLPDVETALFFGKVYKLSASKLSELLNLRFQTDLITALTAEGHMHSIDLQDYIVEVAPPHVLPEINCGGKPLARPKAELLSYLWEDAITEVAKSISEVADKLLSTLDRLPSKTGTMAMQTMRKLNKQRNSLGVHQAVVQHQLVNDVAVVLDVSGSMTEDTIRTIISDVVALSWDANAHLIIVSNDAFHWEPGSFTVNDVLAKAQFGGTHYEMLAPLFNRDWGTVITIADYDSSQSAADTLRNCTGRIGQVLDVSLVPRPSFMAEALSPLAGKTRSLMVAKRSFCW